MVVAVIIFLSAYPPVRFWAYLALYPVGTRNFFPGGNWTEARRRPPSSREVRNGKGAHQLPICLINWGTIIPFLKKGKWDFVVEAGSS